MTDFHKKFPAEFKCDDGHFVRSRAEMLIDNWLYKNQIAHAYEIRVFLPENPDKVMYCDWYIPSKNMYMEFWGKAGTDDYPYRKRITQKSRLYMNNDLDLLDIYPDDLNDLDAKLTKWLKA